MSCGADPDRPGRGRGRITSTNWNFPNTTVPTRWPTGTTLSKFEASPPTCRSPQAAPGRPWARPPSSFRRVFGNYLELHLRRGAEEGSFALVEATPAVVAAGATLGWLFNGDGPAGPRRDVAARSRFSSSANAGNGRFTRFSISSGSARPRDGDWRFRRRSHRGRRVPRVVAPLGDVDVADVDFLIATGSPMVGPSRRGSSAASSTAVALAALRKSDTSIVTRRRRRPRCRSLPTSSVTLLLNSGDRQSLAPLIDERRRRQGR